MKESVLYGLLTDLRAVVLSWCILGVYLTDWSQNMQLCLYIVNSISFLHFLLARIISSYCTISFSKAYRVLNQFAVNITYHLCCTPQQRPQRPPEKLFRWPKSWKLWTDYWNISIGCTPCIQVVYSSSMCSVACWYWGPCECKDFTFKKSYPTFTAAEKKLCANKFHHLPAPVLNETTVNGSMSTHLHPWGPPVIHSFIQCSLSAHEAQLNIDCRQCCYFCRHL